MKNANGRYNGWANRPTWVVALNIGAVERYFIETLGMTPQQVKDYIINKFADSKGNVQFGAHGDTLTHDEISVVNWDEIAEMCQKEE